jgi:hypothetical protein
VLRSGALPRVAAALASGDISARHAQVIATGVEGAPAGAVELIEAEVVDVAAEADVRSVSSLMRRFQHALDPESADAAAMRRWERRGLTLAPMLDGAMDIRGTADETSGAVLATAVDTIAPLEPGDARSGAQRRLDGLTEICRRFLADPDAPRRGGGGRPHLIVTIDQRACWAMTLHEEGRRATTPTMRPARPAGRWAGSGRSPPAPRNGSAATRPTRSSASVPTARCSRPARRTGTSGSRNAGRWSPATATAACGPGATARSPGLTGTTSCRWRPVVRRRSPTVRCRARATT